MGCELKLEFPEAIIERIQSLLARKEAARTTVLSKSWHSAWLTRPNLELNESDFEASSKRHDFFAVDEFSEYAKKTIKRYEQSNLKIDSFKLCMKINCYAGAKLANKLIVRALGNLGPTRLNFRLDKRFVFPCDVVFGADNLVELSLQDCKLNLDGIVIKCCRLESLCLDQVDSDSVSRIILSCPLIEKLSVSNIIYRRCYRDEWEDDDDDDDEEEQVVTGPIINNLHRLKCLVLCYGSFKYLFPGDLLSKFPFLTDFTLNMNREGAGNEVHISNCSLQNIKIEFGKDAIGRCWGPKYNRLKVRLDVPNIRKFSFVGDSIPMLSFVSSSSSTREWESHVSIVESHGFDSPVVFWFRVLNELLTELRQSKIHLSLHVDCQVLSNYRVGALSFSHKQELESLTIDMTGLQSLSCYALFDGLFRLCRPKLVIPKEKLVPGRETNIDLLWHSLEQGMHVSHPKQFMYGLNDLEETNAQIFDDVMRWRPPIPLKSLLLLEDIAKQQRVRLLLKWKPSLHLTK